MSLFEIEHPLGCELNTILSAVEGGMDSEVLPSNLKIGYTSPLDDADGCTMLRVADWETENIVCVTVPVFSNLENGPTLTFDEGKRLSSARIIVRDFLGREFGFSRDDQVVSSPFAQVDVIEEGLLLYIEPSGLTVVRLAEVDDEEYEIFHNMLRMQASLAILHEAAVDFIETNHDKF